ncbi:two-component system sensor histidine kinase GlrK [Nitrosospira sp. Nsp5]|uniref:histidine kinase n=1 Tax=Nitrosospira multiformis TaxID=1231 RepID=A0ABY0TBU4_9PROT|nr:MULTISPECIES: HAMP domain-containing sensor histidine kinase [Nitrosospira]PTR06356.1 two-component system sensor histidine kinase GlrK [Nitrosospira sp. Nsp5]SDQ59443.1 two-component system, NtrC family, sensor histidine kinase GlrK [Nitrosospira multiformis]
MVVHGDTVRQENGTGATSSSRLRRKPKSFLKLILFGFALVGLPLIIALINSAFSIDRLADQSRRAVYQAAQIAHGSRVLADEIAAMERAVRQTHILGDTSLLENYFRAHKKFESTATSLFELSLHTEQKQLLEQMQLLEESIFGNVSAMKQSPEALRDLVGKFVPLRDSARTFSAVGYALIEREVGEMQDMAGDARFTVGWQLLALIPFAILLAFIFSLRIAHPIRQIDEAIRTMGEGALFKAIRVDGPQDLRYLGERLDWLRRRLLKLEEQKTRFLQHVSHELKTPLTAMREGADLLAEGVAGELTEEQQRIATILYNNSIQLQRRIEDLLSYSALQTEKAALVKRPANLAKILDAVLQDQNLIIMSKGLKIDVSCPELMVDCDKQKIKVIVDNLLSNAVKFSPAGGCIKIWASEVDEMVRFDILDAGAGVDEVDREKVFEPFYQGRQVLDSHIKGTGLGLSIAREYALAHGGTIELVQQATNGAHFRLTLPIRDMEGTL